MRFRHLRLPARLPGIGPKWGDWALPALVLVLPLVSYLRYQDYPLLSPSSLVSMAILGIVGLATGALVALRPSLLRPVIVAMLGVYYFDVQFNAYDAVETFASNYLKADNWEGWMVFPVLLALFVTGLCATVLGRHQLTRVLSVVFATMLVSTCLLSPALPTISIRDGPLAVQPGKRDSGFSAGQSGFLPPIVHIILDEHAGIAGIPAEVAGGAEIRQSIRRFYESNGFRLYGNAFSQYSLTEDAVSYLVNGSVGSDRQHFVTSSDTEVRLKSNAWFESLARNGYRIRVFQTDYMDFCGLDFQTPELCVTYRMMGLGSLARADLPVLARTQGVIQNFLYRSFLYRLVGMSVREQETEPPASDSSPILGWSWTRIAYGPLTSLEASEWLIDDLRSARPGTLYFAHLLVTHRAFLLQSDCRIRPDPATWYDEPRHAYPAGARLSEHARGRRYEAYFDQLRCGLRTVARILEALASSGLADDAIVIIHGDHGSRITARPLTNGASALLTDADLRDGFSTLFAIRGSHIAPGYDTSVRSVQALFADLVMRNPISDEQRQVFLINGDETTLQALPYDLSAPGDQVETGGVR